MQSSGSYFNSIKFLRLVTLLEGLSLIALMLIAVPIKYLGDNPIFVRVIGPIHGFLFVLFVWLIWNLGEKLNWNWMRMIWKILLATFIPFGTFYFDHKVLKPLDSKS